MLSPVAAVRMRRALALAATLLALGGCRRAKKPVRVFEVAGESAVLPLVRAAGHGAVAALTRTSVRTMRVGDRERTYLLVEPKEIDPTRRYPLVLVFHGDGGEAASFHDAFPFERATGAGAFLAYPSGIGFTWDLESKLANRDVAFVEALVDELSKSLPIDRARVFGEGYSSGGFLANVVACQKSGLFRAIASNAGGAPYRQALLWPNGFTRCPGQAPTALIAMHGARDFGVGIDSGRFSTQYWAYVNGCSESEMETTGYAECRAYRGCPAGKAVVFCEIPSLGHWVWDEAAVASWTFFQRQ